jgi:glycogen(starch) synthase
MSSISPVRRVLMTGDTVGGVWTFALELARGLGAHAIEVVLASMGGMPSEAQWNEAASVPNLRLFASDYRLEWMAEPWRDIEEAAVWLKELEARFAPDVIHLNTFGHGTLPWNAPVVLTAHSCVLSWWRAVRGGKAPAEWDRYRKCVAAALRAAQIVTAPSRWMLRSLEENYGPVPQGRAIPNGRDAALFQPAAKEPFILSAGRVWDEAKNISLLDAIAAELPWPVYVAGESQHPDEQPAHKLKHAVPLGVLNSAQMREAYSRAAIYALPARYEPFGLSALEAAHSGCALVLGDIPSLREIWGNAAVFVSPAEPKEWSRGLRRLAADPAACEDLGRKARRRALEFTPEKMRAAYAQCYLQAIWEREDACAS